MRRTVNRIGIALVAAALTGTGMLATAAADTGPPSGLRARIMPPRVLPGYRRVHPLPHALDLRAFSRAAGLDPRSRAKLARSGFVSGIVEELAGPQRIPPQAGSSTSSAVRFHTPAQARNFQAWIIRTYLNGPPPPGIHVLHFDIPGIPGSYSLDYYARAPHGRLDEYDTLFTPGRYLCEEDIFTINHHLTRNRFVRAVSAFHRADD
jgi:hypothetical protein